MRLRPDLVLGKLGRPILIVEAKGRDVPERFESPVFLQLREYAENAGSEWGMLVEPTRTRLYRGPEMSKLVVEIPTREILTAARIQAEPTGERILLLAVERWLRALPETPELLRAHPELGQFADAIKGAEISREAPLEQASSA